MAIGDNNNSGNNNKPYENTYYSRIRFKNGDRQVNINFHSGLMQLEVGSISQTDGFKFNSEGSVYLSANKAITSFVSISLKFLMVVSLL